MLVKWITCEVDESKISLFSTAQEKWGRLREVDGFLGQIGGWGLHRPNKACILACWSDYPSYKQFMEKHHDEIFENSNQKNTYKTISVALYEKEFDISEAEFTKVMNKAAILRIADCLVGSEDQVLFERMQQEVWNPGMAESTGMLAGVFCKDPILNGKYLVATVWDHIDSHRRYVENEFPLLQQHSGIKEQAVQVTGNVIELEPKWLV